MAVPDYLDQPLGDFAERLAAETPAPGGGSAAAITISFAAALVAMVARRSRGSWSDAAGVAAQARELQGRVAPLAQADAEAWTAALELLAVSEEGRVDARPRNEKLERTLARAADIPLQIAEAGADVASLAALAAEMGDGTFRGDAAAAALLAAAAARAAANLVAINLATMKDDERLTRARLSAKTAAEASARSLDSGP